MAHPLPAPQVGSSPHTGHAIVAEDALVPAVTGDHAPMISAASPLARLPVEVDVAIPVRGFRVRNLLAIEPGHLIETQWSHGDDLPLAAGQVQLAWTEFEVQDTGLSVRVTRVA